MRENDLFTLMLFVTRTGMYIGKVSEETIVAFIIGYEIGTNGACSFTELLSDLLSSKYGYKKMATGWPGQIKEYSEEKKMNWEIGFKKITLECFYQTQDFKVESEFKQLLKTRIESKIDQIGLNWVLTGFGNWSYEWIGLVDLNEEKFKSIWNKAELEVLIKLDFEIKRIQNSKIQSTDILLGFKNEYLEKKEIAYR